MKRKRSGARRNNDSRRPFVVSSEIKRLAEQLHLDIGLLFKEIEWALGEQRINTVTPSADVFREWSRRTDGLYEFWKYARYMLNNELDQEEVRDLWDCIDLTLNKQSRKALTFQDYLIVAAPPIRNVSIAAGDRQRCRLILTMSSLCHGEGITLTSTFVSSANITIVHAEIAFAGLICGVGSEQ